MSSKRDEDKNYEFTYELLSNKLGESNKRMFVVILILISALLTTNAGWLYYTSQFGTEEMTMIEAEQEGDLNIIGGGDVNYGSTSSSDEN